MGMLQDVVDILPKDYAVNQCCKGRIMCTKMDLQISDVSGMHAYIREVSSSGTARCLSA